MRVTAVNPGSCRQDTHCRRVRIPFRCRRRRRGLDHVVQAAVVHARCRKLGGLGERVARPDVVGRRQRLHLLVRRVGTQTYNSPAAPSVSKRHRGSRHRNSFLGKNSEIFPTRKTSTMIPHVIGVGHTVRRVIHKQKCCQVMIHSDIKMRTNLTQPSTQNSITARLCYSGGIKLAQKNTQHGAADFSAKGLTTILHV